MCGQVGIIFGQKRRRIAEREYLNEVFIRMLLCSEERGPHASGMAWIRTDGLFTAFNLIEYSIDSSLSVCLADLTSLIVSYLKYLRLCHRHVHSVSGSLSGIQIRQDNSNTASIVSFPL